MGYPGSASARAMYYNKDILDAAASRSPWGIDMTTDEGQAAFAYYTWNNGGGFVDDEGNWTLNSEQTGGNEVNYGVASIPSNTGESVSAGVMDRFMCFDNDYSDDRRYGKLD